MERLSLMGVHISTLPFTQPLMACFPASHNRPQRNRGSGLQDILAAERLNEWGKLDKKHHHPKLRQKRNTKRIKVADDLSDLDPKDDDYEVDTGDSTSEVTDASEDDISNREVSARLSITF